MGGSGKIKRPMTVKTDCYDCSYLDHVAPYKHFVC